jgi:hypothetical protein
MIRTLQNSYKHTNNLILFLHRSYEVGSVSMVRKIRILVY